MTEGEVVEQLVNFTSILLVGVSVIFSIISAYVVALNYFIGEANLAARLAAFAFLTLILGMLFVVMYGAQATHAGLIERLHELQAMGQLTAAGRAAMHNADGGTLSIDNIVKTCVWTGLGLVYAGLIYLTFVHRWRPDVVNVAVQTRARP